MLIEKGFPDTLLIYNDIFRIAGVFLNDRISKL